MDENGDPWDNTWEPAESVTAPTLLQKFLAEREAGDVPYYDEEDQMWKNLPEDTVPEAVLVEDAGYYYPLRFSCSDEDDDWN